MTQRIEVPAACPDCGAKTCVEYAGHSPIRPFGPPVERVQAVHCGSEHDGGQDCDWRMKLDCAPGAEVVLVPVDSTDTKENAR